MRGGEKGGEGRGEVVGKVGGREWEEGEGRRRGGVGRKGLEIKVGAYF